MNFDYSFIINYINANKEDAAFIRALIKQAYQIMLKLIARKLEYKEYEEIHRITKDSKIYIDEVPIDIAKSLQIFIINSNYENSLELEATSFVIDPENKAYVKIKNNSDYYTYPEINNLFYSKTKYSRIIYWGGYQELPEDLLLLLALITKFFYNNRDPGVTQYRSEQLTKVIGDYNPEVLKIIGAWKCHHI